MVRLQTIVGFFFIDRANMIVERASVNACIACDAPVPSGRDLHFASLSQGEGGSELSGPPTLGIGGGGGGPSHPSAGGGGNSKQKGGGKQTGVKRKSMTTKDVSKYLTDASGTDICTA